MPEFYVVIRHAPTEQERAALRAVGCTIVAEFGPTDPAPSIEPPILPETPTTEATAVRVAAESESGALDRVVAAGIDDATIWRNFPLAALP
jgi:hypothetical protein